MLTAVARFRRELRSAVGIRRWLVDDAVRSVDVTNETDTAAAVPACTSSFLNEMIARGFANQCTDYARLDSTLLQSEVGNGPMLSAYIGFDATARSLHVGNLIQLMMLRRLQRCGHRPILLLGGGTTLVGDPSGRDKSREMLSEDVIERNAVSLAQVFGRYVELSGTVVGAFSNGRGDAHGA